MNGMQKNTGDIVEQMVPALEEIHNVNYYTEHIMAVSMQHILSTDAAQKKSWKRNVTNLSVKWPNL